MTKQEFAKLYNPDNRCLVTYSAHDGKRSGIALDTFQRSTNDTYFVQVDSFANKVRLKDVIEVTDTGKPWVAAVTCPPVGEN